LAMQTHEPKMKVVPLSSTTWLKLKEVIEFFRWSSPKFPTWRASCRCFTAKLSEVYFEKIVCRHGLVEIRTRWCKEHKDLDRFRPSYHTFCVVVCIALGVEMFWKDPCPLLYSLGGQGYMESTSRVLLESYYNEVE